MSYFVTGATGFIGRNLVELLLEREGTIYVLVREGSKGRLQELRSRWGTDDHRVVGIPGDLSQPRLGVSEADLGRSWTLDDVGPATLFRLYRATAEEHFVLIRGRDPERGSGVDRRERVSLD